MGDDYEMKENLLSRTLKRPPHSPNENFTPKKVKRKDVDNAMLLKDCVNVGEASECQPTVLTVSVILSELIAKVAQLEDDYQPQTPTSVSCKEKKANSHRKRMTEEEKAAKEQERQRKAEERRIKLEKAAFAKQLRQKQKEEAAEARRIEREKKEKEREEHRRMLEEKRKAEEELKRQKELKRKEEEEKREQKRKEEEERREQKRLEEEERRERKRREEEAEELRKKRISSHFMSFFSKKERISQPVLFPVQGPFRPFQIKEGMIVAPIQRRLPLSPKEHENLLKAQIAVPYLSRLPVRLTKPKNPMKAKLFQFHDNYRPPYYGTWRKKSTFIKGRKPFAKDMKILDYEVDSDEEWEEEDGDADDCDKDDLLEEEEKDENESDDEDGFLVDHGYLSAGEGDEDDIDEEAEENVDGSSQKSRRISVSADDETLRKNRLKAKAAEWKANLDQKFVRIKKLRPTLYGPVFSLTTPDPLPPFLEPMILF